MAKWLEEGLEGMKAALDQAQWMGRLSSDGHPSPLKQAYLNLREEVPYLDVGCVVALLLLLYLLWRLMLNAYKQRQPMVINMCSAEEYERLGREYTMRQVAQLMKSKEYQEHMARRGTDPAGFNWQKRAASGGAYVE
ncbi:unnamed protein product [Vitrella brassicaformis CCMP3155]|uniref:Uncharacterized protein n=1 Tax=Vitrella brassicaformis (strain CCMP3155) TaxID=1169540 RepID=A0A0G4G460_VITBC|nr:unnamed protein product [Vitrella brassicaformis CCMP3155]|mmetsp:Transcript_21166/g.51627  ORF Transcript_21166/g.51627 Transcript_21166/m.51627 type:complete len:137 (-) Transcript_21166:948-1358(-)|eukprot:CEM23221.1 unnamed protein product [Vitrella brassicaformis CCMP3155]